MTYLDSPGGERAEELARLRRELDEACRLRSDLAAELAHRHAEERLLLDAVPAMIWFKDAENRVLRANRAAAASLGLAPAEVEGRSTFELYPDEAADYHADDREVIATGRPKLGIVEPLQTATGEKRWIETDKLPYRDGEGRIVGVIVFAVDVTERRWAETLLASQNRTLRQVGEGVPLADSLAELVGSVEEQAAGVCGAVLLLDPAGERLQLAAAPHLTEELRDFLQGATADYADALAGLWSQPILGAGGRPLGRFCLLQPQPRPPSDFEARLLASAAGLVAIAVEATEARERLLFDALHDPLTGLPNRALLLDRLEVALKRSTRREGSRFAVLFIDLDRFKVVNDSLGHMLGDELLKAIAGRLRRRLRPGDTAARLGGDEFALLLDDLAEEAEAARLAEQIQEDLTAAFDIDGQEVFSSASIGIALGSAAYARAEEPLRDADTAMYRAKAQGRARYAVFQPDMHQRALTQLRMESALRRALDRRELRLHYQPVVELGGGKIVGFEALLRWQHPELGLLGPDEFLAAAEEAGVLAQFEGWVLREACEQGGAWHRRPAGPAGHSGGPDGPGEPGGPPVGIYVNIQALQHSPRSLLTQIEEALAEADLPAECLHCELTERALLQDLEAGVEVLAELRALGVGVCLDDFGTGYSSLSYLLRFPVSTLKIDRSFMGSHAGGGHTALVESINTLAHTLDLAVIAEGIETSAQLATVRRLGCEYGQGFLFSPALDPAAAGELLAREPLWVSRYFAPSPRQLD